MPLPKQQAFAEFMQAGPDAHSHLPPHPIPLGHPSAPALSTLSHAL